MISLLWYRQETQALGGMCVCVGVCVPTKLCSQEGQASRSQQDGPGSALLLDLCCQAVDPPDERAVEGVTPAREMVEPFPMALTAI